MRGTMRVCKSANVWIHANGTRKTGDVAHVTRAATSADARRISRANEERRRSTTRDRAGDHETSDHAMTADYTHETASEACTEMSKQHDAHVRAWDEVRCAESHRRIAAMPKHLHHEAMRRLSRSFSAPDFAVTYDGCRIEGHQVVWRDGERWPRRAAQ